MASEVKYRCRNTGGPDGDCEFAASDEIIEPSSVTIGDDGVAYCSGETVFGEPCGAELEEVVPPKKLPLLPISLGAGLLVVISIVIWFLFLRGSALLRVDVEQLALSPGETVRVELFNDGEVALSLDSVEFTSTNFSLDTPELDFEIAPGESEYIRVKLAQNIQDSVESSMTLFSNSAGEPVTVELSGNANPWNVADRLNSRSSILDKN